MHVQMMTMQLPVGRALLPNRSAWMSMGPSLLVSCWLLPVPGNIISATHAAAMPYACKLSLLLSIL